MKTVIEEFHKKKSPSSPAKRCAGDEVEKKFIVK